MVFCNNAAVAATVTIWFSDCSTRYGIEQWKDDMVQDTRTGRLLRRRADGTVARHLDGLAFANGVALAPDESFVAVAESAGAHRRTAVADGRACRDRATCSALICPATPTTSPVAPTA